MMLLTFVFTVFWSVEVGIIVSVSVSLVLIVQRSSRPHINILVRLILVHLLVFISLRPRFSSVTLKSFDIYRAVCQAQTAGNRSLKSLRTLMTKITITSRIRTRMRMGQGQDNRALMRLFRITVWWGVKRRLVCLSSVSGTILISVCLVLFHNRVPRDL